jgi:hypothetical protein
MTCHRVCNNSNTTGATSGTGTAHLSIAREFTLGCLLGLVAQSLLFCAEHCLFCCSIFTFLCRTLFVLLLNLYFSVQNIVCLFAHFLLPIALSVRLWFIASDYPFDIFKLFIPTWSMKLISFHCVILPWIRQLQQTQLLMQSHRGRDLMVIYLYLHMQYVLPPLKVWVRFTPRGGVLDTTLCDNG